jgi:hydroxypyruvate reductase
MEMDTDSRDSVALAHPDLAPLLQEAISARYRVVELASPVSEPGLHLVRAVIVDGSRPFDKSLHAAVPNLGLIACFNAGYDGIDIDWARKRGIVVTHAQDVNHEDVADFAVGQILNIYRKISAGSRWVRDGEWQPGRRLMTRSIAGLRLGIVGLGSIGHALARRADALRMVTSWWAPRDQPNAPWPRASSLIELARDSDVLVVAASADERNRGLISASVLQALGSQSVIINVARGSLVDEDAVIDALQRGALGAAALDVYQDEPTSPKRWADVPHTFLSPHIAGVTDLAVSRMAALVRANLDAFFDGEPVPTPVRAAA